MFVSYHRLLFGAFPQRIFPFMMSLNMYLSFFFLQETVESLRSHAMYQRKMFDQAVQLVRPGGVLVYSTLVLPILSILVHRYFLN